jgi:hypothetical protein
MPSIVRILRDNSSNAFIGVGVVWLAVAVLAGSAIVLWPVVTFIASGIMLRVMPSHRFTWAWVVASASLGFILSAYLVYAWAPFIGGTFSTLAAGAMVGFAIFAVVHVLLFYVGLRPAPNTSAT